MTSGGRHRNVQDNEGTAEASKKGKEGGKEGEEGRQKGRYVERSTKVSVRHVATLSADAAPEPKSLGATDCLNGLTPLQWLRQPGDVHSDPPRLRA
jgi:hypothetical protein